MRVLITGGAGYIGLELAYRLESISEVTSITLLDSLNRDNYNIFSGLRKFESNKINFIEGDILDNRVLAKCIESNDLIFHLAGQVPSELGSVSPHHFEQINNWGLSNIVDTMEAYYTPKTLVNFSTLSVFGFGEVNIDEDKPNPSDYYSVSKLRGERHLKRLTGGGQHRYLNLRLPTVFGYSKNLRIDCPINRLVFDANFKKRIQIHGENNGVSPYIYIKDLLDYVVNVSIAQVDNASGHYYPPFINVDTYSVYEVLKEIHPNLEVIILDQGVYNRDLVLSGKDLEVIEDKGNRRLKQALIEFTKTFTF